MVEDCCCYECYGFKPDSSKVPVKGFTKEQKSGLFKIIVALSWVVILKIIEPFMNPFFIGTCLLSENDAKIVSYCLNLFLYGADYVFVGHRVLFKAVRNISKGKIFDENFLMVVATLGAIFLGVVGDGQFAEAVAVMAFYQLGEWFEGYAVGKSRKNITELMDIRPDYANVEIDGSLRKVDPVTIEIGTFIVAKAGEKVPIDGIVLTGETSLDTSALTGESVPRSVGVGDEVISGCICQTGVIKIKTTKLFGESTVSKILELVENASENKSQSEAFITRFARIYTPCVCAGALALSVLPTFLLTIMGLSNNWFDWVYRACTFLVISCPCALVISVPLSFFAGIGCASQNGVLIKGSNYLEALTKLDLVVFDKTGTLTQGVFEVTEINVSRQIVPYLEKISQEVLPDKKFSNSKEMLLFFVACAECSSSHPIAKSICCEFEGMFPELSYRDNIFEQKEFRARGVSCEIGGIDVKVGKLGFVGGEIRKDEVVDCVGSVVYVSLNGKFAGSIVVSDVAKETSKEAIATLKGQGVSQTIMLTGDNEKTAQVVADELEIDEVRANLMPEDKVKAVEELQNKIFSKKKKNKKIAFVGDGINDAPVLMCADIGIAMGAMGSDAAIEAADVVLMDDNPMSIPKSLKIAKKCKRIVTENIIFALFVKFSCLILGAFGIVNMYFAIFADVGVMVIAVLNAMRALKIHF